MSLYPAQFEEELMLCWPSLRSRARAYCRNESDVEDLLQDTLERALRYCESYTPGTNLRAWLHQILFSVFVSSHRRTVRERLAMTRFGHEPVEPVLTDGPTLCRVSPRLGEALAKLPEKLAEVVRLVDVEELSYREAADTLEVPVGTIMSRLFRARRRIASEVEDGMMHPCRRAA